VEIESFQVGPDKQVTLQMRNMPTTGVRTSNTTVYIAATPLGAPESVSGSRQTIAFSARTATHSGKISVIVMVEGDQLECTSAEDYEFVPEPVVDTRPRTISITPSTASAGASITIKGRNLKNVKAVSLTFMINEKTHSHTVTLLRTNQDGTSLSFALPAKISAGTYHVGFSALDGERYITSRDIHVE
jgi:hypothetical protein